MNQSPISYRSRISPIIWGIVWLIILPILFFTVRAAFSDPDLLNIGILFIIWIPILAFILYIMFGIHYVIDKNYLIIKIGKFTESKILINDIGSINRSYSLIASPANSLKRLQINYADGEVLISPKKERDFIEHLKSLNSTIKFSN